MLYPLHMRLGEGIAAYAAMTGSAPAEPPTNIALMTLSLRVLVAVGAVAAGGMFVAAAAWSRAPSQGSPTATPASATVAPAGTPALAPVVTPTPPAAPAVATGTPAATNTAVATAEVPGAVTLSNGRFFPLAEGTPYRGFAVLDEQDGPAFATAYHLNGGFAALGRPVTRSFRLTDGAIYQLFAHGLLRWQPGTPAVAVTTVDLLAFTTLHGLEDQLWWLGVPRRAPPRGDRRTLTPTPSVRLQWLTEPAIAAHYRGPAPVDGQESTDSEPRAAPAGLTVYGWPESRPEHSGAYIAQRFERAVLIVWVTPPADGPPTGTVEVLPLGLLVAHTSVFQGLATAPDTLVGGRLVARAPRPALDWPVLPTPTPTAVPPTATATAAPEPVTVAPGAVLRVVTVFNEGRREHVVITNEGSQAQNLQGWVLESAPGGQRYTFPAVTVAPGATVRVHSGQGSAAAAAPPTDLAWTGRNVWNNAGDTAILFDPTGREVSRFSY